MKTTSMFTIGFSSMITAAVLFTALGALATHELAPEEPVVSQAEAEALLNFRIEDLVGRHSRSGCFKDLKMMSDERLLDPQLPAYDTMNAFGLLNLGECTETEDTVPLIRTDLRELARLAFP